MKKLLLGLGLLLASLGTAGAQGTARVVAVCGTVPLAYTAGSTREQTVDVNGKTCTDASGSAAATIADGADVAEGATTDAAATAGGAGTVSAKLRTLTGTIGTAGSPSATMVTVQGVGKAQGDSVTGVTASPVMGAAQSAEATAVATGQFARLVTDLVGKLINLPYANPENALHGVNSTTAATATQLITAQGGSYKIYITGQQCSNSSAAAVTVQMSDLKGSTFYLPATGGNNATFPVPLQVTANTAFTFTPGLATTTVRCNVQGYKGL